MKQTLALALALQASACGLIDRLTNDEKPARQTSRQTEVREPAPPIAHERLKQLLPKVEAWQASDQGGGLKSLGDGQISWASADYSLEAGEQVRRVKLEIVDGNHNSSLHSPFALFAHASADHALHRIQDEIEGHPLLGRWNAETGEAHVVLSVAKRFRITLRGEHVTPKVIHQYLQAIDVKRLAAWAAGDDAPKTLNANPSTPGTNGPSPPASNTPASGTTGLSPTASHTAASGSPTSGTADSPAQP